MMTKRIFAVFNLLGRSSAFVQALDLVERFAASDATVLILGETGTGKELAARATHYLSGRCDHPFVPVNCGAIPDSLVESEFFGHSKGAFTDAREARQGLVMQARGGTLFLDEIEAMSLRAQGALLRFLQTREYRPVGGTMVQDANVRVIAASNSNLTDMVQRGLFRADLLFRLNVLSVHLPALRHRPGDVPLLAQEFVDRLNRQSGQPEKTLHPQSIQLLETHGWPGNVRELEHLIQREFLLAQGDVIHIRSVGQSHDGFSHCNSDGSGRAAGEQGRSTDGTAPYERRRQDRRKQARADNEEGIMPPSHGFDSTEALTYDGFKKAKERLVTQLEISHLVALLIRTEGNLSLAARLSGRDRSDISKLLKRYGLDREQFVRGKSSSDSDWPDMHRPPPDLTADDRGR